MKPNRAIRVLALILLLLPAACGEKIEPGNTAPATGSAVQAQVATAGVTRRTFLYEAVGTVTAETVSTLSSKLMGTVRAIRVREGDRVQANDLLVVIDPRQVDAQLRQSEAGLAEARQAQAAAVSARAAARAAARLARTTYESYLGLQRDNSVSRPEFDEVEARFRQAEASLAQTEAVLRAAGFRVQQAEAALTGASASEKDAAIHAPYDGIVTAKRVEVGDLAAPGTPLITLEGAGNYRVDLLLPETHLQSVKPGQT
ncbi:MAG: HlyD family efflux transporter periplasmic adaptor subunit, partial [Desulfobacterales bacterium]|nr:HlyD family efflux transporter periplasmic adaptor subunit [Desulfobacterales bacterium]